MKSIRKPSAGLTLLEIMIVLVIIGVLMAIALPSYMDSVVKSRRAEGKAMLLDLQNRMERFFVDRNTYADACVGAGGGCGAPNQVLANDMSEDGHYQVVIFAQDTTSYQIEAQPQGDQQAKDAKCGTLTLTNTGQKGITGTGTVSECW